MTPKEYWAKYKEWYLFTVHTVASYTAELRPMTDEDFNYACKVAEEQATWHRDFKAKFPSICPVVYGVRQ